ncbi:uncharacterized protein LOC5510228 [Nematostella vectensis]|uniref:uncharacterized protein LOC5510228 n=1 Tax=Nematostella vectensis TaxID=45351 RepID=UPI002077912A|nr:uncharacterized protein LOC5510228 [Nematostella vectensis]
MLVRDVLAILVTCVCNFVLLPPVHGIERDRQTEEEGSTSLYKLESTSKGGSPAMDVLKFLHIIPPNIPEPQGASMNSIPTLLSYYKRKVYPDKLDKGVANALESHIEGIEPQFRSESFGQLWNALREPLTEYFRPKKSDVLLKELALCIFGNLTEASRYNLPSLVMSIRRDLVICKIGEILQGGDMDSYKMSAIPQRDAFRQLWKLLRDPITPVFRSDLPTLVTQLVHYSPKFELAGVSYSLPGKMPDIQRDVAICKVDDLFNDLYENSVQKDYWKLQKDPDYFP